MADKRWSSVHAVGRRAPGVSHPKLVVHLAADLSAFAAPRCDDVFIALGTTIRTAGSREAFRAVDLDAVLSVARAAHAAGASRLALVSAMGADPESSVFYTRTKGEVEAAVCALGFDSVVIARPSLLVGNRAALQQPGRPAEALALRVAKWLAPLIRRLPRDMRPVAADDVAAAMVRALATSPPGSRVLLSGDLQPAS
ncbi:MAG: epimerase [Comamonadaceae bacterium]|nr:MAG: epimerase [Comamonadaceae bacterium]